MTDLDVDLDVDTEGGLYQWLLGDAVEEMAPVVRAVHVGSRPVRGSGTLEVRRAHPLASVAARWLGLPAAGSAVPLQLTVVRTPRGEVWTRRFGGRELVTEQCAGRDGELVERGGWGELRFRLGVEHGTLCFRPLGASVRIGRFRVPLPRWLRPHVRGAAAAGPDGGRLAVCFTVGAPLVGTVLSYHVELEPSA